MCDGRAAVNGRKPGMWNMGETYEWEYDVFQTFSNPCDSMRLVLGSIKLAQISSIDLLAISGIIGHQPWILISFFDPKGAPKGRIRVGLFTGLAGCCCFGEAQTSSANPELWEYPLVTVCELDNYHIDPYRWIFFFNGPFSIANSWGSCKGHDPVLLSGHNPAHVPSRERGYFDPSPYFGLQARGIQWLFFWAVW